MVLFLEMLILKEKKTGGNQDLGCIHVDFEIPIRYFSGHVKKACGCVSGGFWVQAKDGRKYWEIVSL